jgi:DNA-binding MarR family transcriptional regulator
MKRELSASGRSQKGASRDDHSRNGISKRRGKMRSGAATKPGSDGREGSQEGFESMAMQTNPDVLVGILRDTVVALVRRDGPDLSARQLGVFLTVYLTDGPHTVRGLAAELNVSKPAITRALDRLGELDLARRKVDPMDRRSVLVQRTLKGAAFLRDMRSIMDQAAREAPQAAENPSEGSARRAG